MHPQPHGGHMTNAKIQPAPKPERKKTDESLINERDKTDASIIQAREKTEVQTDKHVETERAAADFTTRATRKEADVERSLGAEAKITIKEERKDADRVTELERTNVDALIGQERKEKNASDNSLLFKERVQTDRNLQEERVRSDSKERITSGLLSNEITEHLKTKVALTSRDEFLAIVSHDLRNPLGAISSWVELFMEENTKLDLDFQNGLELIKRNADTALRLIRDILDMESIAEGKFLLKSESHRIDKILKESVQTCGHMATTKNIHLTLKTETEAEVVCDHDRILQVLSNLIGNAAKFTPEGGSIFLSAKMNATEVQVSVRDTGIGIPPEKQEVIFERFAQLAKKDRQGLGLGLYISKLIIEAHQGRLWVESVLGEGSTFSFTIPVRPPFIH